MMKHQTYEQKVFIKFLLKWINQYQKVNCIHEENVFEVYGTLVDHWMYVHVQYTKKHIY